MAHILHFGGLTRIILVISLLNFLDGQICSSENQTVAGGSLWGLSRLATAIQAEERQGCLLVLLGGELTTKLSLLEQLAGKPRSAFNTLFSPGTFAMSRDILDGHKLEIRNTYL